MSIEAERKFLNETLKEADGNLLDSRVLDQSKKIDRLMNILSNNNDDVSDINKFVKPDGELDTEYMAFSLMNKMISKLEECNAHCPQSVKQNIEKEIKDLFDKIVDWKLSVKKEEQIKSMIDSWQKIFNLSHQKGIVENNDF